MSIVIESTSSVGMAVAASAVFTKPTGLALDDYLVGVIFIESDTIATPSGWTNPSNSPVVGVGAGANGYCFYKKADSSDVAASTFTFTPDNPNKSIGGVLMRVSGVRTDTPFDTSNTGSSSNDDDPVITLGGTITPVLDGSLFVVPILGREGVNSYTSLTNGGTALAWTERYDSGGVTYIAGVFTAVQATIAGISTITITADDSGLSDYAIGAFVFGPRADSSVSPSALNIVSSVQEPTVAASIDAITLSVINISSSVQAPVVAASDPDWANQSKTSTTWTNQSKS